MGAIAVDPGRKTEDNTNGEVPVLVLGNRADISEQLSEVSQAIT